jgi:hypothetical protein
MFTCWIAELFSFALFMENYIWKKMEVNGTIREMRLRQQFVERK